MIHTVNPGLFSFQLELDSAPPVEPSSAIQQQQQQQFLSSLSAYEKLSGACLAEDPSLRPTFDEIIWLLQGTLEMLSAH